VQRVVSGSGRVLAIVPAAALTAAATYRLEVSGLADAYGGAVAVAPVTFTTRADTVAVFDPEQVTVSFPDDNGIVHVTAPPGAVPALTSVLIINAGNGIVAQFQAGNDGSMDSQLTASIRDRLIVTITDPQGRSFSFERNTYVAADGTTGVGSGGGKVKSATTDAEIQIPEGAIDDSAVFKLDGVDLAAVFPDDPSIADLLGATIGSSIKIEAPPDLSLAREAHLAFPKPENAPADAFYFVYRRLQGPDGKIAYETIDEASPDPATGKIVTHSPPFSGFVNSINGYGDGGVDPTGGTSYTSLMYSLFDAAMPGKALMGVITGKVLRPVIEAGASTPRYVGVPNALVSGVDAGGQPLTAAKTGANVAISQKDGTFTLFDNAYQGGTVTLHATSPDGETKTATAYESNPQDLKSPGLGKYRNIATANITFPAKVGDAPPAAIDIAVFTTVDGQLKRSKGTSLANTPMTVGLSAKNATVTNVTIQGATYAVRADTGHLTGMDSIVSDPFVATEAGAYTIVATAAPASGGTPVTASLIFRAIAAGGSGSENLPGQAPAVVTAATAPSNGATGVEVTMFPHVTFTEPVKGVASRVVLQGGGDTVPVELSGDGPEGPVDAVTSDTQVVTSLTVQPIRPLLYNTTYTLTLTNGIVDLDTDAAGQPAPLGLPPFATTFTTFGPGQIGQASEAYTSPAIVVLGNRGYLAVPLINQSALKVYDVSDPTALTEIVPATTIAAIGYPYDLVGEEESPLTGGRVVAMATGPIGIPYRPSNVHVYDVATDQPQWLGAVTLGNSPSDGIARRTVMKDGLLYAATGGMGKGIQIVDLNMAISNFQTATANGTSSREYYQMLAQLGLEGQGFGQDAIVNTIFVDTGSGANSRLWDLAVGDLAIDDMPTRIVAATGAHALVLADAVAGELFYNGPVIDTTGVPALIWGYSIGLTKAGTRDIAVVVGLKAGAGGPALVTVDLTDPRHPVALGSLSLESKQVDFRAHLLTKDAIVYVGGIDATTIVDVSDPLHPRILGRLDGIASNLALTADGLLFGIASPLDRSIAGGVKTGATTEAALVKAIRGTAVTSDAQGRTFTSTDVKIDFALVPEGRMASAHVEILRGDDLVETLSPSSLSGSNGQAIWPANRGVVRNVAYYARAVVDDSRGGHFTSVSKLIPLPTPVELKVQQLRRVNESVPNKLDPGAVVMLNSDDDNGNRTPDLLETGVAKENDLTQVGLFVTGELGAGQAVLEVPAGADRIKIWTDAIKTTSVEPGKTWQIGRDIVPPALFIEGIKNSAAPRDTELRLKFSPESMPGMTFDDRFKISVVEVDLDVDSLNQAALGAPARSPNEDAIEDVANDPRVPGKYVAVNNGDEDKDDIPGFADGFNRDPAVASDDTSNDTFVPIVLALSNGVDISRANLKFSYDAADPAQVTRTGAAPEFVYSPGSGHLRIWTKNGNVARRAAGVAAGGDFVAKDVPVTPAQLGLTPASRTVTLYLEAVAPGAALADQRILVELQPDSTTAAGFVAQDAVRVTPVAIEIVDRARPTPALQGGSVAWIVAEPNPTMPLLQARIVPNLGNGLTVNWSMRDEFQMFGRNDVVNVPAGNGQVVALAIGQTWDIAAAVAGLAEELRIFGGSATVTANIPGLLAPSVRFRIRGRNPIPATAKGYIDTHASVETQWFAYAIAKSETKDSGTAQIYYNQFYAPNSVYDKDPSHVGVPFFRPTPAGWGIMQLDFSGQGLPNRPTIAEIWNWQANVKTGLDKLNAAHGQATTWMTSLAPGRVNRARPFGQRPQAQIDAGGGQYVHNPDRVVGGAPVAVPTDTTGNCTFADGTSHLIEDAVTMKIYNSASRHYVGWNTGQGWVFVRTNPRGFNYVARVCAEVER
jgi:hypothetical protein